MVHASEIVNDLSSTELLVEICKNLNATTYLSGPSGRDYLDIQLFDAAGIKVEFFEPQVKNYYSTLYNITKELV